jgi:hypothetical protein
MFEKSKFFIQTPNIKEIKETEIFKLEQITLTDL